MTRTMESENVCCMKPQMRRFEEHETAVGRLLVARVGIPVDSAVGPRGSPVLHAHQNLTKESPDEHRDQELAG